MLIIYGAPLFAPREFYWLHEETTHIKYVHNYIMTHKKVQAAIHYIYEDSI